MFYIKIIFSFILLKIEYILPFICLFISYKIQKELLTWSYELYELKYENNTKEKYLNLFLLLLFFIIIFSLGFMTRIMNIGKNVYLIFNLLLIEDFFALSSYFIIICFIFKILCYICLFITIIQLFKQLVFTQFMKIHLYLISKEKDIQNPKYYLKYIEKYEIFIETFLSLPLKPLYFVLEKEKYNDCIRVNKNNPYILSFVIILVIFLYDLIYNDFIISKIFYCLPLFFIYILFITLFKFYKRRKSTSIYITSFFYHTVIKIEIDSWDDKTIYFSNNFNCLEGGFIWSIKLMQNNFIVDPTWPNIKYT